MKKQPSTFCVTLALMTFATLLFGAPSEPAKTNTDASPDAAVNQSQQTAGAPSPKTNGINKAAQPARLSFGVDEVVKMYQGGVETDVVLNYVENSSVPYHLSAEEVVRLHDIGVPSPIITTLIRHGAKVQQQAVAASAQIQQKATEEAKAASGYANPYPPSAYYAPPTPVVNYNYTYPEYAYAGYPAYYSYPGYCYTSPFYFSFGYPGYRHFYSHGGFRSYSPFGFGGHIGFGHAGFGGRVGFGGGFHGGRHR